jgi:hypothetical protein
MAAGTELRVVAPALPKPPQAYTKGYSDQFNNILRLYFNRIDRALSNLMSATVPYNLRVSQGIVTGASSTYKFGFNSDIDTAEETLWTQGGVYAYSTSAALIYLSSTDANDTVSGTGARTVTIEGLDSSYVAISETLNLNGQTQVATTKQFIRVNRMYVVTAGAGETAAGTLYVGTSGASSGVPTGTTYAAIPQGDNQSQMAVYTVPALHSFYIDSISFTAAVATATNSVTTKLMTRETSGVLRTRFINVIENNHLANNFEYPIKVPAKTDIELRAIGSAANNQVSGAFEGVLIAD